MADIRTTDSLNRSDIATPYAADPEIAPGEVTMGPTAFDPADDRLDPEVDEARDGDLLGLRAHSDRLAGHPALQPLEEALTRAGEVLVADPYRRDLLQGRPMGHSVHPALTDLPIGFWTSAFLLDFGGRRLAPAADLMIAAGLATAAPTAVTGLADWMRRGPEGRRMGTLHAAATSSATVLYGVSLVYRLRGRRGLGVLTALAAATVASAGGYLGGRLALEEEFDPTDSTTELPLGPVDGPAAGAGDIRSPLMGR